ncbi:DUF4329 domain-containing protein [Pseudomonas sp. KCJK9016]|uniref:DUF4329 domain-containing protein n=1 Tax=Pseudomonas sp. KCJK9016 TaxID=3344556 RepID=UPI003906B7D9
MNDVSSRDTRAAVPPQKARLPKLSPIFLTEEDAAYWVHNQIPRGADREYGSVILRLPEGEFAASKPLPGEVNRFDFRTIIDVDSKGNYVHPRDYTCVANVHSHPPAYDMVRKANPGQDEASVRLFLNFFSDLDFIADVSERTFFGSAYLSGPDGSLLKYSPSGSPDELSYYQWLRAGAPPGHPAGAFGVENIVRKVASVGELKVIVSNADWGGSVGKVPSNWQQGKAFGAGRITELPLMTRVCGSAERAVLAALKNGGSHTAGLVLKKQSTNDYVATLARPFAEEPWNPARFFPAQDNHALRMPPDCALEGFYYASRPDPSQFSRHQPWLYENFFTPPEMALAIVWHARSKHLGEKGRSLSLYMQARDASLLKYGFSDSDSERGMGLVNRDGTIRDGGEQGLLRAGRLKPQAYVLMLARIGRLEVLRGSLLWGRIGTVGSDWVPFAGFAWPTLGRAFLSADDAARHVHAKIGERRDRQYAGYIFQSNDQRFYATEPVEGAIAALSQGMFYPRDNAGRPIFPDDHVLQAHYVSHLAVSTLDPSMVQRLKWTRLDAILSLHMFSVEEMRQALLDEIPLYMSGAQRVLLRFEASETAMARKLALRLGSEKHPGPLVTELQTGTLSPVGFIREQAAAGRLTVVLNSELWGARATVTPDWSPGTSPQVWKRPEQVAFGAVFSSSDEAADDQYTRDVRLHDQEKAWFGFILKHKEREEYVATELVPIGDARNDVFQPQSLFGVTRMPPWYQYPEGFRRHAFFYSRQRLKHPVNSSGTWLSSYFIPPDDLFIAVYYSRRRSVTESAESIPLYISTQDGALLKFDNRKGNALFDNDIPHMGLEEFKRNLASGKLSPEEFVRVVARHGGLTVMRTSLCWDRPWPVDPDWRAGMNLQRRWLGPAFQSPDDAVESVRARLTGNADQLFGGVLLRRADGLYLATDPVEVPQEDFDVQLIFPDESLGSAQFPEGCLVVARYRTRRVTGLPLVLTEIQKETYLNMLSVDTLYSAMTRPGNHAAISEYLFAPDGSLIRYDVGVLRRLRADLANALHDFKGLPDDLDGRKIKQQIYSGALLPGAWVDALARSGYLQVVTGSRFWGERGALSGWAPYPPSVLPSVFDYHRPRAATPCSPMFIQPDGVARHVNAGPRSTSFVTFGFILTNTRAGLYFGSMPVSLERTKMALDSVFPQGVLPSSSTVHGLYLRSAQVTAGARDDDPRHFMPPPTFVQQVCAAAYTPQGYKLVYLSCADGALLRFEMAAFEPGEFLDRYGQIELRPNQFASVERAQIDEVEYERGRIDLEAYILRMARAGTLAVILTSDYWSRPGVVDESWQPRTASLPRHSPWAADQRPVLGPVFHHADDAARYAQLRAGSGYHLDNGYESAILERTPSLFDTTPRFVALEPLPRSAKGESPVEWIFRTAKDPAATRVKAPPLYPEGYTLVASHQLHLSGNTTFGPDTEQVYANFASPAEIHAHTHELKGKGFKIRDYYYSTPHGVLIRYTPAYTQAEKDLLLFSQPKFTGAKWETGLSPAEIISRLIELSDFRVLIPGHYWRQTGRMGTRWRERRQQPAAVGIVRNREEL